MAKRKQTPDVLAQILGAQNLDVQNPGGESALLEFAPQETAEAQVRWEYLIVTFQDYKGWRPRFLNGQELHDWTNGPLIHDYLDELGEQGWELAAASAGERLYGSGDHHQVYFKRLTVP